jgi:hypothetical protein
MEPYILHTIDFYCSSRCLLLVTSATSRFHFFSDQLLFFFLVSQKIRSDVFTVEFNFFRKFGDDLGYDELLLGNDWLLGLLKKLIDLKELLVNIFFKQSLYS